eukprot:m.77074 g.77074  ORF g.77074 m.77074 type:complete len:198 (-) comp13204_c0_seq1:20-613(-)
MFGLVAAGRLLDTNAQQVDVNKFVFPLPDPESIKHIAVMMLGTVPLDPDFGAAVYLCWNNPDPLWLYLGFISNEKPSAMYKIDFKAAVGDGGANPFGAAFMQASSGVQAQVGLSIEPLATLRELVPATSKGPHIADMAFFTQKMLESFYNFAASFALTPYQASSGPASETYFPTSTLQRWHERFLQRLQQDPGFWKK